MLTITILAVLFAGFLALFWLTPIGVPTLKRLGGGATSPDLRFGYRPDETYRLFDVYGAAGLAHWRRMLWLDMIFPGVYAALFALLMVRWAAWAHPGPIWSALAIGCPIAAGASDYIENALLLGALRAWPRRLNTAVGAASIFTQAKFICSWATLAIPIVQWAAAHFF
jgi:hypothetical protein